MPSTIAADLSNNNGVILLPPAQHGYTWKESLNQGWESTKAALQVAGQKTANFFVRVGQGIGCLVVGVVMGPYILWSLRNSQPYR